MPVGGWERMGLSTHRQLPGAVLAREHGDTEQSVGGCGLGWLWVGWWTELSQGRNMDSWW